MLSCWQACSGSISAGGVCRHTPPCTTSGGNPSCGKDGGLFDSWNIAYDRLDRMRTSQPRQHGCVQQRQLPGLPCGGWQCARVRASRWSSGWPGPRREPQARKPPQRQKEFGKTCGKGRCGGQAPLCWAKVIHPGGGVGRGRDRRNRPSCRHCLIFAPCAQERRMCSINYTRFLVLLRSKHDAKAFLMSRERGTLRWSKV